MVLSPASSAEGMRHSLSAYIQTTSKGQRVRCSMLYARALLSFMNTVLFGSMAVYAYFTRVVRSSQAMTDRQSGCLLVAGTSQNLDKLWTTWSMPGLCWRRQSKPRRTDFSL